jgi:hypothetical protein
MLPKAEREVADLAVLGLISTRRRVVCPRYSLARARRTTAGSFAMTVR